MAEPTQTPEQPEPAAPKSRQSASKAKAKTRPPRKPRPPKPPRPQPIPLSPAMEADLGIDAMLAELKALDIPAATAARAREVFEGIGLGMSIMDACLAAGVSRPTYYVWRAHAEAGVPAYVALMEAAEAAARRGERYRLRLTHGIATGEFGRNSTAAPIQWLISRVNPDRFGDRQRVIVSAGSSDLSGKSEEELLLEIERLRRGEG